MARSKHPTSDPSVVARAAVRLSEPTLLAKLYRYATVTLHLAAIDAETAGVNEALDLVHTLLERGFAGELPWRLTDAATDDQLVPHACRCLFKMHANLQRRAARSAGDDALDGMADEAPGAFALLLQREQTWQAKQALARDADVSAQLEGMLEGMSHAQIAAEHGWIKNHAEAVRKRAAYALKALGAKTNHESEDEPPSSGPRGNTHDLQTPEERRGAPDEPHRGDVRARRRA
jgi:hypothetical protein